MRGQPVVPHVDHCIRLLCAVARVSVNLAIAALLSALIACGGGGSSSGSGGSNQPSPDFTLSLSSSSVSIDGGGSASFSVSVTGTNGFSSPVTLQILGLPTGITFSPSKLQVSPGSALTVTLAAAVSVSAKQVSLTVSGTSGSLTHNAPLGLTLNAAPALASIGRTRYTRTDAATEYSLEPNGRWMVYDSTTNRFFVSDPGNNRIVVLDAAKQAVIASIPVPGAYGIDETPDHTVLYAGTQIGDVYAIDPVSMQVKHRFLAAEIGSSGFPSYQVRVLANGELAMLGTQGGLPGIDGYGSLALWNPATNSITVYGQGGTSLCVPAIGGFTLTGDRSLIVLGSSRDGSFCTLNPTTGQQTSIPNVPESTRNVASTPDGKYLLLPLYNGPSGSVSVYSAQTLAKTATISVAGDTSSAASMIVSPDSTTLYIAGAGFVFAYDIASGRQIGWMPNLSVPMISGGYLVGPSANPILQAFDNSGMLAGPMEEGVGFLDTAALRTGQTGSQFLNDYIVPATGPTAGGTAIQFENLAAAATLRAVSIGGNSATAVSQSGGTFFATTPAGIAGPADVYAQMADNGVLIVPEGFSYGPTILEVSPDSATVEGGGTGIVLGYGFGSTMVNSTIPSDLQITVGGKSVPVTGYAPNAYNSSSTPFNLQAAAFTIPSGLPGTSADITVTTPSGTTTAPNALHYLPAINQFALLGAQLAQGIYDSKRDLYYFTDASQIRVFSRTQGQWLSSIQVPAAPAGATHRLWGIALSPNGSQLAVSDASAGMLYLLNPDSPASIQSFPFNVPYVAGSPFPSLTGIITNPDGLTVSDSGMIYFAATSYGGSGFDSFFKIDTSSGKVTDYNRTGFGPALYRAAITSDNATVFFNNDGEVFSIDAATDKVKFAAIDPGCCYGDFELALSPDQSTFEASSYLYDTKLNAQASLVLSDRDALNISYVYGNKLSADGTLLFQPSTNGIDIFDGRLGTIRTRISLPFALSQNFDALVSDGKDNVLVAITGATGSGIAVIDLSSVAEPAPLPYVSGATHASSAALQGIPAAEGLQRDRNPILRSGRQTPLPAIKHATNGVLPFVRGIPQPSLSRPDSPGR